MNIRLNGLHSLLAVAALCPVLLAAAPGVTLLNLDAPLLVKINFGIEWGTAKVPSELNAALAMNGDVPMGSQRYDTMLRESFLKRLTSVFQKHDHASKLMPIEDATESDRGKPILIIELKRWALADNQRFDCYFNARLVTPKGSTDLGTHEYSDIRLNSEYVRNRDVGIEKATNQALTQFYDKLAKSSLIAPPTGRR